MVSWPDFFSDFLSLSLHSLCLTKSLSLLFSFSPSLYLIIQRYISPWRADWGQDSQNPYTGVMIGLSIGVLIRLLVGFNCKRGGCPVMEQTVVYLCRNFFFPPSLSQYRRFFIFLLSQVFLLDLSSWPVVVLSVSSVWHAFFLLLPLFCIARFFLVAKAFFLFIFSFNPFF